MINDNINDAYGDLLKIVSKLLNEYDPLVIAAIMMTQSLSIYRTVLSADDYDKIVDSIVDRKDNVKTFSNPRSLH